MLHTLSTKQWNEKFPDLTQHDAINKIENGQILYFPDLAFSLKPEEQMFLSPEFADPSAKNISYQSDSKKLWGVQHLTDAQHTQMKAFLQRFCYTAGELIKGVLPHYFSSLIVGRTSYRPIEIEDRVTSYRKDDKRLHVDAFPSAPNQGKRILRVFSNINPNQQQRIWRTGEPFAQVAARFLPRCTPPLPASASVLRMLRITKSYRTLYDHYMLQLHDRMKADDDYQKNAPQQEIHFPPGCTWIVQTDDVSHAAMKGQYVLEQTFYLPVKAMKDESRSPLRILEKMLNKPLVG